MKNIILIFLLISLDFLAEPLYAQTVEYDYYYRVYFKDKGENHISDFTPSELFTQRAIDRREKNGIMSLDYKDIPVSKNYLDIISSMGLKLHCTSRWMNTALFKSLEPTEIFTLQALPFVENVKIVKNPVGKGNHSDKFSTELLSDYVNPYLNALLMVKGDIVHNSGYQGWGKLIAVLDGGFIDLDKLPAFENLSRRNGIISTYNFVENNNYVYDFHIHGSDIMCILAGDYAENVMGREPTFHGIIGTGLEADYLLLRTEDTFSEYPAEEDFWAAGAEYADSAGCDIITSSLGYYQFDDSSMDYKFSDMDGRTAFVTMAAEAAFSRGIVVVNSAGNERLESWGHIIAPSDGENVISVGAVDYNEHITTFSSPGPSSEGRIKPDVVAQGVYLPVQTMVDEGSYIVPTIGFVCCGTSFSCPIVSGMIACLMQVVPQAKASEIVSVIREASDRYDSPDNDYGYGIPDMVKAVEILQRKYIKVPSEYLVIGPNPFTDHINITFRDSPEWLSIELFDAIGNLVWRYNKPNYISLNITLNDVQKLRPGIYYLKLSSAQGNLTYKLIKARM